MMFEKISGFGASESQQPRTEHALTRRAHCSYHSGGLMIKTTCERAALADRSNQHAIPTYEQPSNAHQDPSPSLIRGSMASKKNEIKMSPLIDQQ